MATTWQSSFSTEQTRVNKLRELYEGNHSVLLRDKNGNQLTGLMFTPVDLNWLGNRLTDRIVDLVFPKLPKLKSQSQQNIVDMIVKQLNLSNVCPETAKTVSYAKYADWKIYWSNVAKAPALRLWGTEPGEFTWWEYEPGDKAQAYAVQFWREEVVKETKEKQVTYKVCERYCFAEYYVDSITGEKLANPQGVIKTTTAYTADGSSGEYKPVDLVKVFPKLDDNALALLAYEEYPEYTDLPGKRIQNAGNVSDYSRGLQNLQINLDKLAAQRQGVIDFCGFPHVGVPERLIDSQTGMIDMQRWMVEVDYGDKKIPVTITNWDGNLSVSKEQWDLYDDEFYKITPISPAIEGKEGASTSGTARRLGLHKTIVGINRRREQYNDAFVWVIRAAQELALHMQGSDFEAEEDYGQPIDDLAIDWPAPIPNDIADTLLVVQSAFREGLMSRETAVFMLHEDDNWSDNDIQDEIARIESTEAMVRNHQNEDFISNAASQVV